ncbi:large ribosomal subunit protein bL9m isoform X5 [Sparus aurata]|uniref:large ribosomal subunit protein bL9m isoform X4 n=1 Tax=Sparus aurata TaxID=8175 RepID=UPI0011C1C4BF|nr:39S ribosomal protein L9, mitochondrial isoform X4 [Sparus aurata]XP_030268201.1 39S ribosomal protein L9, mitochondrial isoform X5 [Sparus aurata]
MWSSGRRVLQDLLSKPAVRSFSLTPAQSTVVVERWYQVPLSKKGSPPRLHPRRHRIYKLVEDTKHVPKEKMELILTQTVPKLGGRGDTVFVKKSVGRNKLLLQGLAVYPSPENKQMFAEELRLLREGKPEERVQTRTGQLTVQFLKNSKLTINKMPSEEFQVTKEVVQRQFLKRLGVVVPPHALSVPFESVKELGDYWCEVTVNGIDTVRISVSVVPFEDPSASHQQQLKAKAQEQAATGVSEPADVDVSAVKAVSGAAVEAVSGAAVEAASVTVEAVSDAAVEAASVTVEAVSGAAVEAASGAAVEAASVTVEVVSDAAVEAVSDAAVEAVSDAAVEAVSDAAVEAASDTVEAVSDTVEAVSDAAVEAVSDAAVEAVSDAAVKAVSDAAVEAEAGKDSVSQVSEASASEGASAAKETAASPHSSEDTTAPPSDNPKKD